MAGRHTPQRRFRQTLHTSQPYAFPSSGVCVCVYLLFLPERPLQRSPAAYLHPEGDGSMTIRRSNHIKQHNKEKREKSKERLRLKRKDVDIKGWWSPAGCWEHLL